MAKKLLVVTGDIGSGNLVTSVERVSEKEILKLLPIFKKLKKTEGRNWEDNDLDFPDQEYVRDYIPQSPSDNDDVHTIISVELYEIGVKKTLI